MAPHHKSSLRNPFTLAFYAMIVGLNTGRHMINDLFKYHAKRQTKQTISSEWNFTQGAICILRFNLAGPLQGKAIAGNDDAGVRRNRHIQVNPTCSGGKSPSTRSEGQSTVYTHHPVPGQSRTPAWFESKPNTPNQEAIVESRNKSEGNKFESGRRAGNRIPGMVKNFMGIFSVFGKTAFWGCLYVHASNIGSF